MTIENLYKVFLTHPKITTDSRKVEPGDLFFALKGANFDGNRFALQALEKGAAYAIVDDQTLAKEERCLYFQDSLEALQKLARHHRRQFDIPVIAITGSNGKTTTKELISGTLCSHYPCHFTKGNYNNHIGVPLTLLAMPSHTEVAIIEMGANHQGEIDFLCQLAEPTHGLITNIGKAHLEGFGGIEGVKKGKSELYRYLQANRGVAFINRDESWLSDLAGNLTRKIFYFKSEQPDLKEPGYEVMLLGTQPFVKLAFLDWNGAVVEVESKLTGTYNFGNIMAAVALGKYFKVPIYKIKAAIEAYVPSNNRSQIIQQSATTFLLDAYNANPSSMQAALQNFAQVQADRKTVILGDMLELGIYAQDAHDQIAKFAVDQMFDQIVLVGPIFKASAKKMNLLHFNTVDELIPWWQANPEKQGHVLVKGSRGIQLEKLLKT